MSKACGYQSLTAQNAFAMLMPMDHPPKSFNSRYTDADAVQAEIEPIPLLRPSLTLLLIAIFLAPTVVRHLRDGFLSLNHWITHLISVSHVKIGHLVIHRFRDAEDLFHALDSLRTRRLQWLVLDGMDQIRIDDCFAVLDISGLELDGGRLLLPGNADSRVFDAVNEWENDIDFVTVVSEITICVSGDASRLHAGFLQEDEIGAVEILPVVPVLKSSEKHSVSSHVIFIRRVDILAYRTDEMRKARANAFYDRYIVGWIAMSMSQHVVDKQK